MRGSNEDGNASRNKSELCGCHVQHSREGSHDDRVVWIPGLEFEAGISVILDEVDSHGFECDDSGGRCDEQREEHGVEYPGNMVSFLRIDWLVEDWFLDEHGRYLAHHRRQLDFRYLHLA